MNPFQFRITMLRITELVKQKYNCITMDILRDKRALDSRDLDVNGRPSLFMDL